VQPCPSVPEVALELVDDVEALWLDLASSDERAPLPFWAFPWAGGRGLARAVLDQPALVAGRHVLDVGTGSGLCALAALRAGARRAQGVDVDPAAVEAAARNAQHNGLALELACTDAFAGAVPVPADVVLAGDLFYERALALRAAAWLAQASASGVMVLVADPGRDHFPPPVPGARWRPLTTVRLPTSPLVEGSAHREVTIVTLVSEHGLTAPAE
jgi:predicted nicotinamide N-methyase